MKWLVVFFSSGFISYDSMTNETCSIKQSDEDLCRATQVEGARVWYLKIKSERRHDAELGCERLEV